jgi:hypothetical protein
MSQFFGKYRGKVVNNVDPEMLGRIVPLVPAVAEIPLSWAMPCAPFAGSGVGLFALPPIGANVWIEFEGGDPNYPIWTGGFWGEGEVPAKPAVPTTFMLKSELMTLSLDDLQAEMKLEVTTPAGMRSIRLNPEGITLSSNTVTVTISEQAIEARHTTSGASVAPQGVTLKSGPATVEVTPASIGLKNGASSINMSPATVNVNNGALEVM